MVARNCCLGVLSRSVVCMAVQASRTATGGNFASLNRDSMKFLGVVAGSACGFQNKRDQVDTGVPIEFFLLFTFGHEARAGAGCPNEPSVGRERRDDRRIGVVGGPVEVENDIHAAAFGLGSRLGHSWRAWDGLLDEHLGACV